MVRPTSGRCLGARSTRPPPLAQAAGRSRSAASSATMMTDKRMAIAATPAGRILAPAGPCGVERRRTTQTTGHGHSLAYSNLACQVLPERFWRPLGDASASSDSVSDDTNPLVTLVSCKIVMPPTGQWLVASTAWPRRLALRSNQPGRVATTVLHHRRPADRHAEAELAVNAAVWPRDERARSEREVEPREAPKVVPFQYRQKRLAARVEANVAVSFCRCRGLRRLRHSDAGCKSGNDFSESK